MKPEMLDPFYGVKTVSLATTPAATASGTVIYTFVKAGFVRGFRIHARGETNTFAGYVTPALRIGRTISNPVIFGNAGGSHDDVVAGSAKYYSITDKGDNLSIPFKAGDKIAVTYANQTNTDDYEIDIQIQEEV